MIRTRTEKAGRVGGTLGNELLTSATAVVLTGLLLAEGVTIPFIGGLLTEHMFIGLLLIPPVVLKLASTGYRFVRYYAGSDRYRDKGPPPFALRALAPLLVLTPVLATSVGAGTVLAIALLSLIEGWQRWPFGLPH